MKLCIWKLPLVVGRCLELVNHTNVKMCIWKRPLVVVTRYWASKPYKCYIVYLKALSSGVDDVLNKLPVWGGLYLIKLAAVPLSKYREQTQEWLRGGEDNNEEAPWSDCVTDITSRNSNTFFPSKCLLFVLSSNVSHITYHSITLSDVVSLFPRWRTDLFFKYMYSYCIIHLLYSTIG